MTDRDAANKSLREVLRRGDPEGDGRAPSGVERATLRRRMVDAARASSSPAWSRLPVFASALTVAALLVVASLFWLQPDVHDAPSRVDVGIDAGNGTSTTAENGTPPPIRNVQFVTRGGTRIVWVLNRNLDI